jgi:putative membrane protein
MVATVTLWVWHAPPLYEAALRSDVVHALEHATFFATSLAFWSVAFAARRRRAHGAGSIFSFLAAFQNGLLGALITLSPRVWYEPYGASRAALQDQQLAGVLMWVPAGVIYITVGVAHFVAWIEREDRLDPQSVAPEFPSLSGATASGEKTLP